MGNKITQEEIDLIINLLEEGLTPKEISIKINISSKKLDYRLFLIRRKYKIKESWSKEMDALIINMVESGESNKIITKKFEGKTLAQITERIRQLREKKRLPATGYGGLGGAKKGCTSELWSDTEIEKLKSLALEGYQNKEIANFLRRTIPSIRQKKYMLNIKDEFSKPWDDSDTRILEESLKNDESPFDIASKLQKNVSSIYRAMQRLGLEPSPKAVYISNNNVALNKAIKKRLQNIKTSVIKRGLVLDITETFILNQWDKQKGRCYYSGIEMKHSGTYYGFSIERINSNGNYTEDNVVLTCRLINQMKWILSSSDFITMCGIVHNFNKSELDS